MAGVAARPLFEVILVLRFGFPKIAHGCYFRHNLATPKPGCIYVGNRVFGYSLLVFIDIVDARAVREPPIISLSILCGGIVDLEEILQDIPVARLFSIESDFDSFRMRAVIAIGGV